MYFTAADSSTQNYFKDNVNDVVRFLTIELPKFLTLALSRV